MDGLGLYIAQLSTNMAQYNVQSDFSMGMLKNVMESQEAASNILIEGLENIPSPDGRGTVLDVRA